MKADNNSTRHWLMRPTNWLPPCRTELRNYITI